MKPLKIIEERKSQLFKNLVLVSLLSIGISLLANFYSTKYAANVILFWMGLFLIVIVIIAYLVSFYRSKEYVIKEKSLFLIDKECHFVPIKRFRFSEEMGETLLSVFKENKTFEDKWRDAFTKKPATTLEEFEKNSLFNNKDFIGFVGELLEYIFLKRLSLLQDAYFNSISDNIEILTREKISRYVLQNRVLEMISKPFEERSAFSNSHSSGDKIGKTVYMISDGVVYERFELKLPKGTTIKKDKNNTLVIKNRNYSIYFKHGFDGYGAVLPIMFEDYYLNKDIQDISKFSINPELKIKLNPFFFLFSSNWKSMNWIDVICEEFSDYFSFDRFVEKIGYEYALTNKTITNNCMDNTVGEKHTKQMLDISDFGNKGKKYLSVACEESLTENERKILEMIVKDPNVDEKQLAEFANISIEQTKKTLLLLMHKRIITREFHDDKKSYWEIVTGRNLL